MNESLVTAQELLKKRDAKAIPHLSQYAPVWIVEEKLLLEEDAIQFNVLFQHNTHGWINRRYRYDGFNDTLYHKGQHLIAEDDALDIIEKEPYINAMSTNVPNSYGG